MIPTHNTEVQVRKSLAIISRFQHTALIFTMPNDKMKKRMSQTRIQPIVDNDAVFNLDGYGGKEIRSLDIMQIQNSFMFVTGSTEGDATSTSADFVMNDEVDLTDQQMLALFNSRLQNSDHKVNQRFSTPTFTGFGIDKGFQLSDQHVFLCRCTACNHWNDPQFDERHVITPGYSGKLLEIETKHIDEGTIQLENGYVCCEKCRAPLDLSAHREWVPKYPSRSHARGYRVHPFSTDRLSVSYIVTQMLKYRARNFERGWWNTVIGQAHTAGSARLSEAQIESCFTPNWDEPDLAEYLPHWLGIDMGQTCHLTLGRGATASDMHVVKFMSVPIGKLYETVEAILNRYNIIGGTCDRHPYTPNADALRDLSHGRIVPVEYRGTKEVNIVYQELDPELVSHAQANRTMMIDDVAKEVRLGRIQFSGYGEDKQVITDHLKDMVRDENPETPASWVKLTGNDHYFHSLAFLLYALKLKTTEAIKGQDPRSVVRVVGAIMKQHQNSLLHGS